VNFHADSKTLSKFTGIPLLTPIHSEKADLSAIRSDLEEIGRAFETEIAVHDLQIRPRAPLIVSKLVHCLYDLIHRWRSRQLPIDVAAVVSNHDDMRSFTQ